MAESLVPRRREWRPLEPDAGNAVEGSEGPIPDWRCQPCDFPRMAFYFMYHGLHGCRRWPQSSAPLLGREWSGREPRHGRRSREGSSRAPREQPKYNLR